MLILKSQIFNYKKHFVLGFFTLFGQMYAMGQNKYCVSKNIFPTNGNPQAHKQQHPIKHCFMPDYQIIKPFIFIHKKYFSYAKHIACVRERNKHKQSFNFNTSHNITWDVGLLVWLGRNNHSAMFAVGCLLSKRSCLLWPVQIM